jgi:nucleoside-diphosphate-sugar epimerase
MTKIAITGASGFLGGYLNEYLKAIGLTVIPYSRRLLPGMSQILNYGQTPKADFLIHLAEEADREKVNKMGETYLDNATDVLKVLSRRFGKDIIYASSGVVYGDENKGSCRVDMPVRANDAYSKLKLRNEKIVLGSGGVVVRLSNLFGVGMTTGTVMSDIIHQIPGSGPMRIRNDKPVRDFLPVSESTSAFGRIIESNYSGILNVGSGIGTSISSLASLFLEAGGQEYLDIVATQSSSKMSINVLDISETKKFIGWSPNFSLKEKLSQLLDVELNNGKA